MAYNPAADADCQAWWRFEDGTLTLDSSGKGNTLTNNGVSANTVDRREGSACGAWVSSESDNMGIDSANLSEGYPFRPGSANRIISICFWMKLASFPSPGSYFYVYVKWLSVWVLVYNDGTGVYVALVSWFSSGGNYEIVLHESPVSTGVWYHVGVTYNGNTGAYRIRIWNDGPGEILGSDKIGAFVNVPDVDANNISIGYGYDGLLDDYLVFSRVLSAEEIDGIRNQTFGSGGKAHWYYELMRKA
jgi:hypothetical protein